MCYAKSRRHNKGFLCQRISTLANLYQEKRFKKVMSRTIQIHLALGLAIRLLFILIGDFVDENFSVKFTDIDYIVFSDASYHVYKHNSPYKKLTYRYTPLLSWMLVPNIMLHENFGKLCFVLFDVLCAVLMYLSVAKYHSPKNALTSMKLWLYNPFSIVICTRGSAEAVMSASVLCTIYFLQSKLPIWAGLFYGFSIHFKIYPIIYCALFVLSLNPSKRILWKLHLNLQQVAFIVASVASFASLTMLCYYLYGEDYMHQGFMYHLTRKDIKHNFSVYFYVLYLGMSGADIGLICFLPQIAMVALVSMKFPSLEILPFSVFLVTAVFVTFNKVVTSQYFLWYLTLLPLIVHRMRISKSEGAVLTIVWLFAQGSWLLPAYFLEYEGKNTFTYIWVESLAFLCSNVGILGRLVKSYDCVKKCSIN